MAVLYSARGPRIAAVINTSVPNPSEVVYNMQNKKSAECKIWLKYVHQVSSNIAIGDFPPFMDDLPHLELSSK